ncbi:ABC transporter ATP-binding protein [uncultured Agrococcus sp.]|uniref:ABC transporter ATP-binding protein n=1 Tax=uncultured Agrococcus sp. TaxID=382258 RepID=UPI0025E6C970|nr:ABC transporter ATP-binding protein [uncultured Agrococcus sp.]
MQPVIECAQLTKRFGAFTAVRDVDFSVEPGTVLGFLGPNGAGKSTTIRMILGLSTPTDGSVRVFGSDPRRDRAARARVGYSPGELRLDDRLTVKTTLQSWERLRGSVDAKFRDELVERFDVKTDKAVRGLSTGNRRKLALVGALMSRPELLVLDEPTNGLDPLVQNEFMTVLSEVAEQGTSVLLSSHIMSEVERMADSIVVIRAGEIVAQGAADELRQGVAQEFRAVFADAAPTRERFSALEGAAEVSVDEREVRIRWNGPPRTLLDLLAQYELESLTAPEPDLETAFLSYYRSDKKEKK